MINRVLIRIKTVQLLYSYLLVQKPFTLETSPESPTKEKRFAYSLYLDTLYLLYKFAQNFRKKTVDLAETRFIQRIESDDRFKSVIQKYSLMNFPLSGCIEPLKDKFEKSLIYSNYKSSDREEKDKDKLWEEIFNSLIYTDPLYNSLIKSYPDYSLSGVERMKGMMDDTFKNFYFTRDNISDALNNLARSMDKARELYMRLLDLAVELTYLRRDQLELNRKKHLASREDLNPNTKFIDNILPSLIENNQTFSDYIEKHKISWIAEDRSLLERMLGKILSSEIYAEYMNSPERDRKKDIEFWIKVYSDLIFDNEDFLEYMEEKSVFWNDDLDITTTFVIKTLKRFEDPENDQSAVMPMYKDREDSEFGAELFRYVVANKDLYREYIDEALMSEKWESDRLAFMDVVILLTAIAEILNFPKIPLMVTINEYIEIAKSYSSSKSGTFVHGLLASIIKNLQEKGLTHK